MCSTYTIARKTKRWSVIIFFQELDIAGINLLTIFLANPEKFTPVGNILFKLGMAFMEENLKKRS